MYTVFTRPLQTTLNITALFSLTQSVDTVCTLYQSFQEGRGSGSGSGGLMEDAAGPRVSQEEGPRSGPTRDATLLRPCPKHMSATERLRKVIQELVDTEKSYVKVRLLKVGMKKKKPKKIILGHSVHVAVTVYLNISLGFYRLIKCVIIEPRK